MKTKTINLYQFSELSDDAKENAISKLSDINTNYEWWDDVYLDAETVKLKITSFDLDRNRHCEGHFIECAADTANLILSNHGESCETYKTAKEFLNDRTELVNIYSDGEYITRVSKENEQVFDDELIDLEDEFLKSLLEAYSVILQNECDYLTSKEAIIETIESNEYEFDEKGNLI